MLICLVTLQMARPNTPPHLLSRWLLQQEHKDTLSPDPSPYVRQWRGLPESRDWDRLEIFKRRDGWKTLSHRREFVDWGERKDEVELAAA